MKTIFLCLLGISSIFTGAFGQDSTRLAAWNNFKGRYAGDWTIRWDRATGTPSSILGSRITSFTGTPEQIATAFLESEKEILGIKDVPNEVVLERENSSPRGGNRMIFRQRLNNVPVLRSGYLVAVDGGGGIYYVSGDYFPDARVNTIPRLTVDESQKIINNDFSTETAASVSRPTLWIKPSIGQDKQDYRLVYKADISTSSPVGAWEYLVDAQTGVII